MPYQVQKQIPVWGDPLTDAVDQMERCAKSPFFRRAALMADHHLGYAVPIGGVIAYKDAISPSAVGFDIACGNKAVLTDAVYSQNKYDLPVIMDDIQRSISFGIGRVNKEDVDHDLFDYDAWSNPVVAPLKKMAREQLGTVGSGNHYVDIFKDELDRIWIGVHFGSRGLGHKIASHYIKAGGGTDGMHVDPVVIPLNTDLGREYEDCMILAGEYAYAGRDWVCDKVASILQADILNTVHNHHNFAWKELHDGEMLHVVRKGATPARPGQWGFVGGTMGENSVILRGIESEENAAGLYSTVHGAGRVMSRTAAAGKYKGWGKNRIKVSEGAVSQEMMDEWVKTRAKVELRGGGLDESPHCYKRLSDVLAAHENTIEIVNHLTPIGVAMAGGNEHDPYKD